MRFLILDLWIRDHKEEGLLPGLIFNQRQLFWIRNAQQWCNKHSIQDLKEGMTGVHTPDKYRLLGSLMLSDEFAKDFNCPKNSKMNPIRTCSVGSFWPENPLPGKSVTIKTKPEVVSLGARTESGIFLILLAVLGFYSVTY